MSALATNDSSTRQGSAGFQNDASNIGNQSEHQTINGGQHNHLWDGLDVTSGLQN
jgi:hypothetical protein